MTHPSCRTCQIDHHLELGILLLSGPALGLLAYLWLTDKLALGLAALAWMLL